MILAAGLTPAWQQVMRFARLRPGEVNRAREVHWGASGKAINVGMALAGLGAPALALSPRGGWSGASMEAEFARRGLPAVWTPSATPTRVCTTLLDEAAGTATELVENAAPLTADEVSAFAAAYREHAAGARFVVLTGSLPAGTPATFYRDRLRETPCPALLDVRGPELLAALEAGPAVVKPNRDELAATAGHPLPDRLAVLAAMRSLIERGARAVVVTHGKDAAWVMDRAGCWEAVPPEVTPVVNPIGCGDCLAAGLAWGLAEGRPLVEAVRLGLAAAAENVTQLLPARLTPERVAAWLPRIVVREVEG